MLKMFDPALNQPDHEVVWLNVSPGLRQFDQAVLKRLSQHAKVTYWQYEQELDEASSLLTAVEMLYDYLKPIARPVHLAGHGLSGVLGLLYARQYPCRVRSLTLLGVAAQPAITWHSYYYKQRHILPHSQAQLLAQTAVSLFGSSLPCPVRPLIAALARDLAVAPCPHSLYNLATIPEGGVAAPLLICGSQNDFAITPPLLQGWIDFFKPGDTFWQCPNGHHFFHYTQSELVAQQLVKFWQQIHSREIRTKSLVSIH